MQNSIFLGNGINLSFGNNGQLLNEMLGKMMPGDLSDNQLGSIPFPLKIVLGTDNNVHKKMKDWSGSLWGEISDQEQMEFYKRLLCLPVTDYLTANYGFELEEAALGLTNKRISPSKVSDITEHMKYKGLHRNECSMFLHTYQECTLDDDPKRIWHIHGHAKNPSSMIIGHYYYGNLLFKIKNYLSEIGPRYKFLESEAEKDISIDSWVDAFILNNIYVIGFSYDFAEMDLWWLLERKNREKAEHGKLIFYEPKTETNEVKHRLLADYGAEVRTLGYQILHNDPDANKKYKEFYYSVVEDIEKSTNN